MPPTYNGPVDLVDFRPLVKGGLRGFATVKLSGGLTITDCPVLESHGKAWASLPSKPILDPDGRHCVDERGKPLYAAVLRWTDYEMSERWSQAVVAAVRALHPEIFDDGSAA